MASASQTSLIFLLLLAGLCCGRGVDGASGGPVKNPRRQPGDSGFETVSIHPVASSKLECGFESAEATLGTVNVGRLLDAGRVLKSSG